MNTNNTDIDMSVSGSRIHSQLNVTQKAGAILATIGLLILFMALFNVQALLSFQPAALAISIISLSLGIIIYARGLYLQHPEGIKNNHVWQKSLSNRGLWAWIIAILLTGFYVLLYWFPQYLGLGTDGHANSGLVALFDPLSQFFKGQAASQWFVYGTLYTVAILFMGYKFILKYRHNRYQVIRTISVMFFQLIFAFLLPEILEGLNSDKAYFAKDIKYIWPLNYYFFESWHIDNMLNGGTLGMFYLVWGIAMIFVISPFLTYFFGKRWYCSWVCGCGGLAETAGDPFRQLSNKSLKAWKLERWLIHSVLVLAVVMTSAVLYGYFSGKGEIFGLSIYNYFSKPYGFLIGAAFSGVVGVGFYPLLGSRVWCRFGCPQAAILGLQQRFFSRFRITTNGGQCISCGNCSTYCEMGIDVRAYAQKGQNIVRASCVGCGVCSAVCPRGVLRLENGSTDVFKRTEAKRVIHISEDEVGILN